MVLTMRRWRLCCERSSVTGARKPSPARPTLAHSRGYKACGDWSPADDRFGGLFCDPDTIADRDITQGHAKAEHEQCRRQIQRDMGASDEHASRTCDQQERPRSESGSQT